MCFNGKRVLGNFTLTDVHEQLYELPVERTVGPLQGRVVGQASEPVRGANLRLHLLEALPPVVMLDLALQRHDGQGGGNTSNV